MNKPKLNLSLEPVQGDMLARISWSLPAGHGADLPEVIILTIEGAIRAEMHEVKIKWCGVDGIRVQVDPIWTEPDHSDALLDANDAIAEEIASDVTRRTQSAVLAAGNVIDMLGMQVVAEALSKRGWKFIDERTEDDEDV